MLRKVLVANRGEIACRILKTLRKMGIASVAVHSEADAFARHVREADKAFCVGGPRPADSYLRSDAILAIAKQTGAEAIHPRYGCLSGGKGGGTGLGGRECFVQRRNQKVIEETPAPGLSQATRDRLFDAALRLGRAVTYRSAGTVEFVLDAATQDFYFLEVNTRL